MPQSECRRVRVRKVVSGMSALCPHITESKRKRALAMLEGKQFCILKRFDGARGHGPASRCWRFKSFCVIELCFWLLIGQCPLGEWEMVRLVNSCFAGTNDWGPPRDHASHDPGLHS